MAYVPNHAKAETFADYLARHQEWGYHTFGSPADGRGPAGPLDHLRKETKEIEHDPRDLKEWTDAIILSIDGMIRAGAPLPMVECLLPEQYLTDKELYPRATLYALKNQIEAVASDPTDIKGWARLVSYSVGGFLNAGGKQTDILPMLFAKQEKNFGRNWPDWRTAPKDKAIEHVRDEVEQAAKVLEVTDPKPYAPYAKTKPKRRTKS